MRKGLFITIEGCDGSGKSTQKNNIISYLDERNIEYVDTREPGGTATAERIRDILLDGGLHMRDDTELLLYTAARVGHYYSVVEPALAKGKVVICDRFVDSTLAYQGYARGIDIDYIVNLFNLTTPTAMPDVTYFLDISAEEAFCRKGGAEQSDRLEKAGKEFHDKVYQGFLELANKHADRIVKVDAHGTADQIFDIIVRDLSTRLNKI